MEFPPKRWMNASLTAMEGILLIREKTIKLIRKHFGLLVETNKGRLLKICFVPKGVGNEDGPTLKSAFEPNEVEKDIYQRKAYK